MSYVPRMVLALVGAALLAGAPPAFGEGERFAVVIGIDDYETLGELSTCRNDARAVAQALVVAAGYRAGRVVLLTDDTSGAPDHPTLATVRRRIKQIAQLAREGDTVFVYFSGHGITRNGQGFLVPVDGDPENAVPLAWVRKTLDGSRAKHKLLVLDVCHAGAAAKGVGGVVPSLPVANDTVVMFLSSAADQVSYPDARSGRSAFSRRFVDGLSGEADANGDDRVTAPELFAYVERAMVDWSIATGKTQTPVVYPTSPPEVTVGVCTGGLQARLDEARQLMSDAEQKPLAARDYSKAVVLLRDVMRDSKDVDPLLCRNAAALFGQIWHFVRLQANGPGEGDTLGNVGQLVGGILDILAADAVAKAGADVVRRPRRRDGQRPPSDRWRADFESRLRDAWRQLAGGLPPDAHATVAVIPLVDADGGVTRLGMLARDLLERDVIRSRAARVAERDDLDALMRERDFHASDLVEGASRPRQRAARLLRADYLVLGKLLATGPTVTCSLRLVSARGEVVSRARPFSIHGAAASEWLATVQRPREWQGDLALPPIALAFSVVAQHARPGGGVEERVLPDGGRLAGGDRFQVRFTPNSDCWVYVFLRDSTGACETLFPYPGVRQGNRCRGDVTYTVPDPDATGGSRWFFLDEHPGVETLYVAAGYAPATNLDRVVDEMDQATLARGLDRAIEDLERRAASGADATDGIRIVPPEAADATAGDRVSDVLRGAFSVVKKFRIAHE